MGLKPFQKGQMSQSAPKAGKLKPFVPRARAQVQQVQPIQPIQQIQEQPIQPHVQKKHPILEFLNNFAKGTASIPVKAALSLGELPSAAGMGGGYGDYEKSGYNIPWLGNTKSYTTDILNTQNQVIQGDKPMRSMVGAIAKPVVDLGSFAIGGGAVSKASKGLQPFAKSLATGAGFGGAMGLTGSMEQGNNAKQIALDTLKNALIGAGTAGVLHGIASGVGKLSNRGANRNMAAPMGRKSDVLAGSSNSKINPLEKAQPSPKTNQVILSAKNSRLKSNELSEKSSSYLPNTTTSGKNVNTPLQEGGKITEKLASKADEIINPTEIKGRERGHITQIAKSSEVSTELGKRVRENPDAFITTRHQEPLVKEAQKIIFDNVNEAERIAKTEVSDRATILSDELAKHYDTIATKAKAAGDEETFNLAMQKAIDVSINGAKDLSETARALSAARRINMLSPEGIIQYVNKAVKQVGQKGLTISNERYYEIIKKAGVVKNILDPKQKALATFDLIDDIYSGIPKSTANKVSEVLNLPRSMMATADLSAPFRQGIFTAAKHPVIFAKNIGKMFKYAFSENSYRNLKADIITSPNYNLYVKHKLPLTDISTELTGREEQFLSTLSDKIPGFGKLSKGSNRAYSGFLNKMRVDLFDDFVKTAKLEGINDAQFFDDAAKFVGSATGRGKLFGSLEPHAGLLNGVFFSPRLMASRINLINPLYYAKLHPAVRKEALKSLGAFVGTGMGVLALAKMNGAEVGTDPRSADFGKIKMGNTRYDIWGGFQQYARFLGQFISGEKISTTTGKESQLGSGGYNAPTRKSITWDFLESKSNPLMSFAIRAMEGEKFGEKFNLPAETIDRFIPMIAQDAFDLSREYGMFQGLAMAIPGAFGVGSQTYGDQVPLVTKTAIGNPSIKWRSQPGLGETILNKVTGNDITNVPQEQWKPLLEERSAEQKRRVEIDAAKQNVLNTGQPQQIGDTYIYLENGVVKTKVSGKLQRTPLQSELKKSNLQPFYQ